MSARPVAAVALSAFLVACPPAGAAQGQWSRDWGAWQEQWRELDAYGARIPAADRLARQRAALAKLERIAPQAPTPADRQVAELWIGNGYHLAALLAHYRLAQARDAATLYAKAAQYGSLNGALGLADVRRFELGETASATQAYDLVRPAIRARQQVQPYDPRLVAWVERWLGHERTYLTDGRRFTGGLVEEDFAAAPFLLVSGVTHEAMAGNLASMPRGATTLMAQAHQLTIVTDYAELVRLMERHDPAGFLSAAVLAKMVWFADRIGPEEAGAMDAFLAGKPRPIYMPGPGSAPAPAVALAERYFRDRGVKYLAVADDPRMQTPEGTWRLFVESLRAGNRAAAIACLGDRMRESLSPAIQGMSSQELRELADSFSGFELGTRSGVFQEFAVTRQGQGVQRAGLGTFLRVGKSWKIDSL